MKKKIALLLILCITMVGLVGCINKRSIKEKGNESEVKQETAETEEKELKVNKKPLPDAYDFGKVSSLEELKNKWSYLDLRGYNLQSVDLSQSKEDILGCDFDSQTLWPEKLPEGFNPTEYLDFHKDPGLGLKKLHEKGITGKGINIAFIDYALLIDHEQYKGRVKYYDVVHSSMMLAQMHASAVVSIAAGKDTGVAPEADIFAIESENYDITSEIMEEDFTWTAQAIDKIIEINKQLPENDKIRVLSISGGGAPERKGYDEFIAAINRAKEEKIFVVTLNLFETYADKFYFQGLDINPLCDKNDLSAYRVTEWNEWLSKVEHVKGTKEYYIEKFMKKKPKEILLLPIDSKTVASQGGNEDYVFYRQGGWSWCMPYIAGLYALCCQVDKDITPEEFWTKALETGDERSFENDGVSCIGKIVNPEKLIEAVKK